mmetsp:Transcript_27164/g.32107  ORF Transcript_27164/g.32107 Transcript_27164/m.32107 type:complete len:139 (-) Transcript_27164:274-690(-)|eukprot:CAMPEP_0198256286 /NCGR_PEP_ID=MMETSP1447-20131203/6229_1 /TAXON_ID=420782 /ORGANISM="Chaetoceros dichaeta, Strain CCMP1751" /LENGTH=138 /DNA_ID=CAMNT_0043942879 /DNA_START=56 /DNA_END=472 /DNA_ORIENTATION=-
MQSLKVAISLLVCLSHISSITSFAVLPSCPAINELPTTSLGMFGNAFKSAFANDDAIKPAQNAGLSNGPNNNDKVTVNGKPVKAVVGQKISVVASAARAKISYGCKAGSCGTCTVKINGRAARACQSAVPSGKCTIQT